MSNWLYNEKGEVRPELYTQSKSELDELQASLSNGKEVIRRIHGENFIPPELDALKSGDIIYIRPEFSVAQKFGGRMTFIAIDGVNLGPCLFCRTEDGGGTFVSMNMLVNPRNPKLEAVAV